MACAIVKPSPQGAQMIREKRQALAGIWRCDYDRPRVEFNCLWDFCRGLESLTKTQLKENGDQHL
jgi:hypothetical protein